MNCTAALLAYSLGTPYPYELINCSARDRNVHEQSGARDAEAACTAALSTGRIHGSKRDYVALAAFGLRS